MKEKPKYLNPILNMMIFVLCVLLLIMTTQTSAIAVPPQFDAGGYNTVGLKSDGTVVAAGLCTAGRCDVGSWTGIVQVSAGWIHTVGLKSDGTVVAAGCGGWNYGQCDVSDLNLSIQNCPLPRSHWDFWKDCGPCDEGEGDCDHDNECKEGLFCEQIFGDVDYCRDFECPYPIGHWDYCKDCGPCGAGQGDCDFNSECQSGMICAQVIGTADVCCPHPVGHWDYCRDCGPCDLGQGDCDSDSECRGGMVCAQVAGAADVCAYQSSQ